MWMAICSMHVGETIALNVCAAIAHTRLFFITYAEDVDSSQSQCHGIDIGTYVGIARPRVWASGEPELTRIRLYIIRYALHRSTSSADPIPILGASYASSRGARLKPFVRLLLPRISSLPLHYAIINTAHTLRLRRLSRRSPTLCSNLQARR